MTTSRDELLRLIDRHRPALVVLEACALAGQVADLCAERGLACKVANTAAEAWKFKHAKRKTDKDDALRLAQQEALGQLLTVAVPDKATREWRALIAGRPALVGEEKVSGTHFPDIFLTSFPVRGARTAGEAPRSVKRHRVALAGVTAPQLIVSVSARLAAIRTSWLTLLLPKLA